jgi:hypothetical protein
MATTTPAFASRLAAHVVFTLAAAAARLLATRRDLVHAPLDAEEVEALDMPEGSRSLCPQIDVEPGVSAWRVACWLEDDEGPEGCLRFDLLGWSASVWYYRRGHDEDTARAHVRGLVAAHR